MNEQQPRVSIGMPVHNGERYLRAALDAILGQTFSDFELIISDNASTDGTETICREYADRDQRIRYSRQERNLGAAANFNFVFAQARGEYFKWASYDDLLAPTFLEYCVAVLDQGPQYVLCCSDRYWMTHEGEVLGHSGATRSWNERPPFHRIGFARLVCLPGSCFPVFVFGLMRREVLAQTGLVGAYNKADLVVVAEMRLRGEFWQLPERLFYERLHEHTPDYLDRLTKAGEARWYDPSRQARRVFPNARILREHLRAIWKADLPVWRKVGYSAAAVAGRPVAQVALWVDPLAGRFWRLWSRRSLSAARVPRRFFLGLRAWAACAGLRRMKPGTLRLAFSRPWSRENIGLLRFAAQRLSRRPDPHAEQLLTSWLCGSCKARQAAAAEAMVSYPERYGAILRKYADGQGRLPSLGLMPSVASGKSDQGGQASPEKLAESRA